MINQAVNRGFWDEGNPLAPRKSWTHTHAIVPEWILLVGGGILQLPAVTAIHELGYSALVTDQNPDCACAGIADRFVQLSTFDVNGHIALARKHHGSLAAVFTAGADPIVTVAVAAQQAGCHGVPVKIAEICADKIKTRFALRDKVPGPRWYVAKASFDINNAIEELGPVIVKAPVGSGSRGHTRFDTTTGIDKDLAWVAYEKAWRSQSEPEALIEELLTGIELSVETAWIDGTMIPLNAVERPFKPDTVIEIGHYNPAVLTPEVYSNVWDVMRLAGCAIGLHEADGGHILKGDLILTDEDPKVLELTTRLSGGFDSGWTSPLAHGVDYTKGALLMALGRNTEAMQYFTPRWHKHVACLAVFGPPEGGIVKEIRGLEEARRFAEVIVRFEAGDTLPPLVDCTSRVAFCIAVDDYPTGAKQMAEYAVSCVEVVVE